MEKLEYQEGRTELESLGEFALIERLTDGFGRVNKSTVKGVGDDCAVLGTGRKKTVVTTDMLVEGTHFLLEDIDPYSLGWKSAAVNLSDIAGMGGKPVGTFLSVALPKTLDDSFLEGFFRGYKDISDRAGEDQAVSPEQLKLCQVLLCRVRGGCRRGPVPERVVPAER